MNSKAYKSYELGKNEYLELKYFCLRYLDLKTPDADLIDRALELTTDNEVIRGYLRRAVTENVPYERLDVPMGRRQFYELRRKFFYILSELKKG